MIRRQETSLRSLRRVFRRLLLVSLAVPAPLAAEACGTSPGHDAARAGDGGTDAFAGEDAGDATSPPDARPDGADASLTDDGSPAEGSAGDAASLDAGDSAPSCTPTAPYLTDASYVADDASAVSDAGDAGAQFLYCYTFVDLPCGLPATVTTSGCFLYLDECATLWTGDGGFYNCQTWGAGCVDASVVDPAGTPVTIAFDRCSAIGRRPAGLVPARGVRAKGRRRALGDYFARAAHLEAASVAAFASLRDELELFGAPRPLAQQAARSARDEVRHARVVGRLARRFGAVPAKVRVARPERRALEEMARENAVEGCVRETFGAMVATWQATYARDPEIRAAMGPIAADETRHAALAWAVARWADGELDDEARARVRAAREEAVRVLAGEVAKWPVDAVVTDAGLPAPDRAGALVASLREALWGG